MKRYLPNGRDFFPLHVDVMGQVAARRFMTAFIYLNAPAGGETVFPTSTFPSRRNRASFSPSPNLAFSACGLRARIQPEIHPPHLSLLSIVTAGRRA